MRKILALTIISICCFLSCTNDDGIQFETVTIANAVLETKTALRDQITIEGPTNILTSGKIFVYQDYVFVNDKNRGVHVIDNENPLAPQKIAFIKIPGNEDVEIRNDILYADSYTDLVLFDISNINNIERIQIYEDVFDGFGFAQTSINQSFDYVEYGNYDPQTHVVVGWTFTIEEREVLDFGDDIFLEDAVSEAADVTGQGGSLARFKIVNDFLYAVDFTTLYVFNIENQAVAVQVDQQDIGWEIETIFNQGDFLYMGSSTGMFIYEVTNPASPQYRSSIDHLRGCDPVVVDGDYAYLTLRGGNPCGQAESILEIIDVSDKSNPFIIRDYQMQEPYGLGYRGDLLFVSDGANGLHIYDKSDPESLELLEVLAGINVFDVIPLEDRLLAIADNVLYQYTYESNGLSALSEFVIN